MDGEVTAEPNKKVSTMVAIEYPPSGWAVDLTGPIKVLEHEDPQTEAGKKFWQAADRVFGGSMRANNPITQEMISGMVDAGIAKTQELIDQKGTYANAEESSYAGGWMMQLEGARDVLGGKRKDSRPLVAVVDAVGKFREELAESDAKGAGKAGFHISEDGRVIWTKSANPDFDKKIAKAIVERTKKESVATHDWVVNKFGAPKDSW
jgi:hypothetical protein